MGLDATLPGDIKATLEGIFSYNFNEVYVTQLNLKKDGEITLPGESGPRELWVSEGIVNKDGAKISGYYLHNESNLHGYYYSTTAQLSKEFNFGLSLMAAYSYSNGKSLTDGSGDQVYEFAGTINKNGNNTPELGNSAFVAPHRVIANIGYNIKEGKNFATNLGLFYEGFNIGYNGNYSTSRISYVMNSVSGTSTNQLIYIPTDDELAKMPFVDEANKAAYKSFIENDTYLSTHRGQYEQRNAILAPWLNRINFHIGQEFKFNVAGKPNSIEVAADVRNIANLLNNKWGSYKALSSNAILKYADVLDENGDVTGKAYTFTEPEWKEYANTLSTWSAVLSLRYKF